MELLERISATFDVPIFVFAIILVLVLTFIAFIIYNLFQKNINEGHSITDVDQNKMELEENFNGPKSGEKWYYRETYKDTSNNTIEGLPWLNLEIDPIEIVDVRGNWVKFKDEKGEIKISPYYRFNEIFMKDVYGDVVIEEPEPELDEEPFGFVEEANLEEEITEEPTIETPGTINIGGVEYTLVKNS